MNWHVTLTESATIYILFQRISALSVALKVILQIFFLSFSDSDIKKCPPTRKFFSHFQLREETGLSLFSVICFLLNV